MARFSIAENLRLKISAPYLLLNSEQQIDAAMATFSDSALFGFVEKVGIAILRLTNLEIESDMPLPSFPKTMIPFLVSDSA